jgi:hypothetical protein
VYRTSDSSDVFGRIKNEAWYVPSLDSACDQADAVSRFGDNSFPLAKTAIIFPKSANCHRAPSLYRSIAESRGDARKPYECI